MCKANFWFAEQEGAGLLLSASFWPMLGAIESPCRMYGSMLGCISLILAYVGPMLGHVGECWACGGTRLGLRWAILGRVGTRSGSCWAILRVVVGIFLGLGHFIVESWSRQGGLCTKHRKYQEQRHFWVELLMFLMLFFVFTCLSFPLGHAHLGYAGLIASSCWAISLYVRVCNNMESQKKSRSCEGRLF